MYKCAGDHETRKCDNKNELKCICCVEANKTLNEKVSTNHMASDNNNCSTYKWLVNRKISNTNYPINPLMLVPKQKQKKNNSKNLTPQRNKNVFNTA